MKSNRRNFLFQIPLVAAAAAVGLKSKKLFAENLTEADAMASSLCFHLDASKVDQKDAKCGQFQAGRICSGCQLYTGAEGSASGPCTLFQNKLVPAKGWCNAWAPKAK